MEEVNTRIASDIVLLLAAGYTISEIRDHLDWLENEEGEG